MALLAGCLAFSALASPAAAQTTSPAASRAPAPIAGGGGSDEDYEVDELVVTASREQPGAVVGDIAPEIQLSPRDIRAYGVSSVNELIAALAPQTTSGQGRGGGRPVILVNGARISSFTEVRDLPTEAIMRVDILPEEVALKYGYPADQKVINLVLRRRFRAITAEAGYSQATQGGTESADARANLLRIQGQNRFQLDAKASRDASLLESERGLPQPRSDAPFRTLIPESSDLSLNSVLTRTLANGVAATLNGSLESTESEAQLGLATVGAPRSLVRESDSLAAHVGGTVAGARAGWRWTVTGNADRSESDSTTQRIVSGAQFTDASNSVTTSADGELVVNGTLGRLPAGPISTTLTGGLETLSFETESTRAGVRRTGDLSRDTGSLQANFDLPLTSRREDVLAAIGNLSLNFNVAAENLSDFGTLNTLGAGLNWSPIDKLKLIASFTDEDGAPTVQQLGNPELLTPGVQAYDFRTGQTVVINRVEGGNPNLSSDNRQVFKLGLNFKPFEKTDVTFQASYVRTRTEDVIAAFPTATTEIETAFPDRFLRNAAGQLVQIDARPVNFDSRDTEQLRWGFTFRKPLGPVRPPGGGGAGGGAGGANWRDRQRAGDGAPAPGQAAAPGAAPTTTASAAPHADGAPPPGGPDAPAGGAPPAGGGFGGPGGPGGGGFGGGRGFGGGGRGGGGGNLQIGVFHTVLFKDEIVIRPGAPVLDLLNGSAIGSGGGESRHKIDLQANVSKNGLGAAVNASWQSATTVRGSGVVGSENLKFSDLTTVNLRLFADLGQQAFARNNPWFRGARATLSVDNLFDARQDVRTASGATPISYQPDYLDPVGRSVRLSFRKVFF